MTSRSATQRQVFSKASAATVVTVHDLRMRYGTADVLAGVDFEIRRGEVVTLLGPNGAGKTTTIEILEGFRARSGGEVEVLGEDPALGANNGDPARAWCFSPGVIIPAGRRVDY